MSMISKLRALRRSGSASYADIRKLKRLNRKKREKRESQAGGATPAASAAISVPGAGYANERMQIQAVKVEEGAKVAPVVMETETGDAIIWMVY